MNRVIDIVVGVMVLLIDLLALESLSIEPYRVWLLPWVLYRLVLVVGGWRALVIGFIAGLLADLFSLYSFGSMAVSGLVVFVMLVVKELYGVSFEFGVMGRLAVVFAVNILFAILWFVIVSMFSIGQDVVVWALVSGVCSWFLQIPLIARFG